MLFTDSSKRVFIGVIFVIASVVFLLSSVGWLKYPIFSPEVDVILAFASVIIGISVIHSGLGDDDSDGKDN